MAVRLRVVGSVLLLPRDRLTLQADGPASSGAVLVRKEPTEDGALTVDRAKSTVPWLEASVARADPGERFGGGATAVTGDWVVRVRVLDNPGRGTHRGAVRFRTGLSREPEVEIPVTVRVRPTFRVNAARVILQQPDRAAGSAGEVLVSFSQGAPEAVEFEVAPASYRVETEIVAARRVRVRVFHDDPGPPPPGRLIIRNGSDRLELPVVVNASR